MPTRRSTPRRNVKQVKEKNSSKLQVCRILYPLFAKTDHMTISHADDVYDSVSGLSSNGYVTATSDVVSAGMALLGPELDNFKTNCDILMKTLDAVAKVHPFVTGTGVSLFENGCLTWLF